MAPSDVNETIKTPDVIFKFREFCIQSGNRNSLSVLCLENIYIENIPLMELRTDKKIK